MYSVIISIKPYRQSKAGRPYGSDEQTPVQEPEQEQDFSYFWPEPEWIRIQVFSSSRIIFGSLFSSCAIQIYAGAVNASCSIPKQDFFGSFAVKLRSRRGSESNNFGAGLDPDLKILRSAHHCPTAPALSIYPLVVSRKFIPHMAE